MPSIHKNDSRPIKSHKVDKPLARWAERVGRWAAFSPNGGGPMSAQGNALGIGKTSIKPQRGGPNARCSRNRAAPLGLVARWASADPGRRYALPWADIGLALWAET